MSETIGNLSELEYRVGVSDNYYWLDGQGKRVSESEVLESFGKTDEKQEVEAIWKNNESDIPVKITGVIGKLGDETYYVAEGSQTGIPGSQIEWGRPADENPEITQLQNQVNQLEALLEQQRLQYEQERHELNVKIDRLTEMVSSLQAGNSPETQTGNEAADADTTAVTPQEITPEEAGEATTAVQPDDEVVVAEEETLVAGDDAETPDQRRGIRRLTGSIGDFLVGRQVALQNGVYNLSDRRNRAVMTVSEEVAQEYSRNNERTGAVAAGALAVGAVVGIAIWELFEHKVFGESHTRVIRESVQAPNITVPGVSDGSGGGFSGNGFNPGVHTEFFNPSPGHRLSAVQLPSGWHLGRDSAGHEIILNGKQTIVSHADVPSGITKGNGVLSEKAVEKLRSKGFKVAYQAFQGTGNRKFYSSAIS